MEEESGGVVGRSGVVAAGGEVSLKGIARGRSTVKWWWPPAMKGKELSLIHI